MKRGLQVTLFVLSLIPLSFGIMNTLFGAARFLPEASITAAMDSQFRFQSAYYLGLAVLIWVLIPQIEKHTTIFRVVVISLFVGGAARLYSYLTVGAPPPLMVFGMVLELCLPLLIIWQTKVASKTSWDNGPQASM